MSTHNNGRDVAVGGNAMIGGDAHIQGNVHVHHNLIVDGWLDAKNIRGANRGIYLTVEDLMRYNPHPREGWFAGVGASSPFAAYVCRMGVWMPTGGTIAINVDMSSYTREIAFLRAEIQRLSNIVANIINPSQPTDTATITVTANDSTMGTVAGGGTYSVGSSVVLVASPNVGYRFVGWSDGNTDNPRTEILVGDETLTAIFESTTPSTRYSVNVNVAEGQSGLGSVNIDGGGTTATVERGSSVTINAVPNALHVGAYFVKWSDGSTSASRTVTINSNMTYTAEFAEVGTIDTGVADGSTGTGTIEATVTRNGVAAARTDIRIGDVIKLTATGTNRKPSAVIDGKGNVMTTTLSQDGEVMECTFTYNGTQSLTFRARFDGKAIVAKKTVSVSTKEASWGTVKILVGGIEKESPASVNPGTTVTLVATANDGFVFDHWEESENRVGEEASWSVAINDDVAYTAVFKQVPPDWYYGVFNAEEGETVADNPGMESGLTPAYLTDGDSSQFNMITGTTFIVLYDASKVTPTSWVVDKGTQFEDRGSNFDEGIDWKTGTYKHSNGETYNWFQYNGVSQGANNMLCEITFAAVAP